MIMIFLLFSWKNDDEFFISGEQKINEYFISGEEKRRDLAEQ